MGRLDSDFTNNTGRARQFGVTMKSMIARASSETFHERLEYYRERVDNRLQQSLTSDDGVPRELVDAMEYSVLGSGKRIRPLLSYATGELLTLQAEEVDAVATAVEFVHAYSLIHDDLPAMDDDDLRRGRPTTHRRFNEAIAILAGDALQALAFQVLCEDPLLSERPETQCRVIWWLARAVGPAGMVGGQLMDLQAEGRDIDEAGLVEIHRRKTGELIRASIMMPSELAKLPEDGRSALDEFASDIGLAFQIRDDLLEVEQDTATLGKNAGSDDENDKSTYPSILGLEGARTRAHDVYENAMAALDSLGENAAGLRWISDYIVSRSH